MLKPFMRPVTSSLLLAAALTALPATAGKEDFKQQIEMSYQSQVIDVKNKTSIIRNNVHIRQGSLNIYADEVEIDATAGEGKEVFTAKGAPASYQQLLEDGSKIEAVAQTIEYQRESRTLSLKGEAKLKQASSQVTGESITFNMEQELLIAEGKGDKSGRVTTIFKPEALKKQLDKDDKQENVPEQQKDQEPGP